MIKKIIIFAPLFQHNMLIKAVKCQITMQIYGSVYRKYMQIVTNVYAKSNMFGKQNLFF